MRDEEQQELAFEGWRTAWDLVDTHRELLDKLAAELLEREVLERDELDRIMDGIPRLERRRPVGDLRIASSAPLPPASAAPEPPEPASH